MGGRGRNAKVSSETKLSEGVAAESAPTTSLKRSGKSVDPKSDAQPTKRTRMEVVSISGTNKEIQLLGEASKKATIAARTGKCSLSPDDPFDCAALMLGDGDKRKPNGVLQCNTIQL